MGGAGKSSEARLAEAVQDLALPGEEALERKASAARRPDALALDFDESYTAYVSNLAQLPTDPQVLALQALDAALSAMSGPDNAELWTEGSVKNHPAWAEIRALARAVVDQFGWATPS